MQTSDNGVNYLVSEIIINDEARARGYITTDLTGENPIYFADVDRVNYTLTSTNIVTNQTFVSNEINKKPKYIETDEYDIIKVIIDLPSDNGNNQIDKFWGWGDWTYGDCVGGMRTATRKHYMFWIVDATGSEYGPCNVTYGDNHYGTVK